MPGPRSLLGVWVYKGVGWVYLGVGIPEEGILGGSGYTGGRYTRYTPYPPVLTYNDGHRSGQYTSYWNVFLFNSFYLYQQGPHYQPFGIRIVTLVILICL